MVSYLIAETLCDFDRYRSHPHKFLRVHMNGVMEGVWLRKGSKVADAAALFHDLGKLNPNFQPKLDDLSVTGYSSHAYLSAHAFLCFCAVNGRQGAEALGITKDADVFSVLALISHHHGSLPDFSGILSISERERLAAFLETQPDLPISEYLQQWLAHIPFDVLNPKHRNMMERCSGMATGIRDAIASKLDFFVETQYGFSCLIEADKRDASDNKWFKRNEQLTWVRSHFSSSLNSTLQQLKADSSLNQVRTDIRNEALANLQSALEQGKRTFLLTAPTGSGKTLVLLTLADAIRNVQPEHAVVYALPFLAITEQVEDVCRQIFSQEQSFVTRIDSRAQNAKLENLLAVLEEQPERISELLRESFATETFDAAFIITTFVQLFETLLSNRGATLLRLPNFSKCIFLLDEIQSLPPRLYVFLTAYLQVFCEKFDAYVVLSTATMPALELPDKWIAPQEDARILFPAYQPPVELLDFQKYFKSPVFNRYEIMRLNEDTFQVSLSELADKIQDLKASCLVILNTIDDTRHLYDLLCPGTVGLDVRLLNTRFTLNDRRRTIAYCQERLRNDEKVILLSTQLIEAGVDIDFPVVFRDLCSLPSLIQSAGRCNRNGKPEKGKVYFFELVDDENKSRAELVYRDVADKWILDFSRTKLSESLLESELLQVQKEYFSLINQNLAVGDHPLRVDNQRKPDNLIRRINEAAFQTVGTFRLIDEEVFGIELQYYVPIDEKDDAWEVLNSITIDAAKAAEKVGGRLSFQDRKTHQLAIEIQLRRMSGNTVQVRVYNESQAPPAEQRHGQVKEVCGLRKLLNAFDYTEETGLQLNSQGLAIL